MGMTSIRITSSSENGKLHPEIYKRYANSVVEGVLRETANYISKTSAKGLFNTKVVSLDSSDTEAAIKNIDGLMIDTSDGKIVITAEVRPKEATQWGMTLQAILTYQLGRADVLLERGEFNND